MANPSLPRSSFLRFKTRAKSFHPLQLSLCSLFDKMESETNCITSIIGNENFTFRNRSDDWKKRDNNLERNKNLAHRRICQNTITLTGQALGFATETIYVVFLTVLKICTDSKYLKHSYIPIYANFIWCLMTMIHIFTSPDMMKSIV